jgi:hypothetical protein
MDIEQYLIADSKAHIAALMAHEAERKRSANSIGWWTGFRAVICGDSFNISWAGATHYQILLPNGQYTDISLDLPEAVTT